MVTMDPLVGLLVRVQEEEEGGIYNAPRDRIRATEILVRRFMFRFQMRGIGSVQSVKSDHMFIAPCAYVEPAMTADAMHEPDSPANCVQK